MSKSPESRLYREIRLDLDPTRRDETVAITLPTSSSTSFLSRSQQKRTILNENYVDQDENAFARRHLASEASVYFRALGKYPRCFLWRLLDDRKVLEIRSVDITRGDLSRDNEGRRKDSTPEAAITFLLGFPSQIKPFGIALADLENRDAIAIFALTTSYELYTITLPKAFFFQTKASELEAVEWCKIFTPSSFSFRYPYRLIATNAQELWFSLHDGGLLHLKRNVGDDGSHWHETFFADGGWGSSLKGLISWRGQNNIRFGNIDLAPTAAAALALSPDNEHLFTVCLNHTLKAWNVKTGKVGVQRDLLDEVLRDSQKANQYTIGTSQPCLMQLVAIPEARKTDDFYYIVTYSPKQHQFKFWKVLDADDAEAGLNDVHGDLQFIPPVDELMNTTVWNLEEFHVDASAGWSKAQIWIRARTGLNSNTYTTSFNLRDHHSEIKSAWLNNWAVVDSGPLTVGQLKAKSACPLTHESILYDTTDPSTPWIDFLTSPGRFSVPTLETALSIYRTGLNHRANPGSKSSLKERLSLAITSTLSFTRRDNGNADYLQFARDTHNQWQVFYGVVQDLHKRRGESVSLAFDHATASPWVVLADYIAPVRAESRLELLDDNQQLIQTCQELDILPPSCLRDRLTDRHAVSTAEILHAARSFRRRLPPSFQTSLRTAVQKEISQDPWAAVSVRLQAFEAMCELDMHASEEDMARLDDSLPSIASHDTEFYTQLLDSFSEQEHGKELNKEVDKIGKQILSRASEETIQFQIEQLLDLLVLTIYVAVYWAPEDVPEDFDSDRLFVSIIDKLKRHKLLEWMSATALPNQGSEDTCTSVLWSMMGADASFMRCVSAASVPSTEALTSWVRTWTFAPFESGRSSFDDIAEDIMADLLQKQLWDLGADFQQFLGRTPWAAYLRGRLYLARGDFTRSAQFFKKAAVGLSLRNLKIKDIDRRRLIPQSDKHMFCDGLPRFYCHIMDLFDTAKASSYVADFAKLALQSPAQQSSKDHETLKAGLLSRFFTASLQISRYDDAYSALVRQKNTALRKSNLTSLVTSMVGQNSSTALLRLPLASLSTEVDAILESLCYKTLNITTGPQYHKILYSYRISRGDFRGAATILYERLQRLRSTSGTSDEALTQGYLILINTLASVGTEQAWIFAEGRVEEQGIFGGGSATIGKSRNVPKRKVVTLEDIRREYEKELDRQSALENGRFAFGDEAEPMDLM